jgi:hypothetical protein
MSKSNEANAGQMYCPIKGRYGWWEFSAENMSHLTGVFSRSIGQSVDSPRFEDRPLERVGGIATIPRMWQREMPDKPRRMIRGQASLQRNHICPEAPALFTRTGDFRPKKTGFQEAGSRHS